MSYALITSASAGAASGVTTSGVNTTGADLLVIFVNSYDNNPATGVSDSKSNSWTALTAYLVGNGGAFGYSQLQGFYSRPTTVGSGHTFSATVASGNDFASMVVYAFSGSVATPIDGDTGADSNTVHVSSIQPGSATPTAANELFVTAAAMGDANTTLTVDSGFSTPITLPFTGGQFFGIGAAYLISSTNAAKNPTWSLSPSVATAAAMAVFKVAGGVTNQVFQGWLPKYA